jgi:hypothetical protein
MKTLLKIISEIFQGDRGSFRKPPLTPKIISEHVSDDGNLKYFFEYE